MERLKSVLVAGIGCLLLLGSFSLSSCGYLQDQLNSDWDANVERSGNLKWGYFVSDVIFTGGLGLIVDFATGAIYKEKGDMSYYQSPENLCDEADHLARNINEDNYQRVGQKLSDHIESCVDCKKELSKNDESEENVATINPEQTVHMNRRMAHAEK